MTDLSLTTAVATDLHTNDLAQRRLRARYRTEYLFQALGLGALLVAAGFLVLFLTSIVSQAIPAFTQTYLKLPIELKREEMNPQNASGAGLTQALGAANYDQMVSAAVRGFFPGLTDRTSRRALGNLVSSGGPSILRREVMANPAWLGTSQTVYLPLDDNADLYLKGLSASTEVTPGQGELSLSGTTGTVRLTASAANLAGVSAAIRTQLGRVAEATERDLAGRLRVIAGLERDVAALERGGAADRLATEKARLDQARTDAEGVRQRLAALKARIAAVGSAEALDNTMPSFFVKVGGGYVKLTQVEGATATGEVILPVQGNLSRTSDWQLVTIAQPEANRRIADREVIYLESLKERGLVERRISREFFLGGASREAELAGVWVAIVGSFMTLVITLAISFPIGVAAAIYLEEFAPKNRFTEIIEVNINNLAAVPSIIYGLLGLAVFLNVFGLPRSAPVVGGLVLALMTLPIIIIASRAAIRAVPPSVKEAALGVGASHQQAVFHHVLPLAMPGILTGTILGMAHALGETAPLLMIGMVAFVVDMPHGLSDAATLLPVQIFMWADFPEAAFQNKTAAAIVVLLVFLIMMNAVAVFLRKRFERRW